MRIKFLGTLVLLSVPLYTAGAGPADHIGYDLVPPQPREQE